MKMSGEQLDLLVEASPLVAAFSLAYLYGLENRSIRARTVIGGSWPNHVSAVILLDGVSYPANRASRCKEGQSASVWQVERLLQRHQCKFQIWFPPCNLIHDGNYHLCLLKGWTVRIHLSKQREQPGTSIRSLGVRETGMLASASDYHTFHKSSRAAGIRRLRPTSKLCR